MKEQEYDFFICHASEDKSSFVKPLVEKLVNKGYRIWYDEMTLHVGDSLIESISNGIKKSLYGIIVLSESFFTKNWAKKELDALMSKEIITNTNLVLPIWLNLTIEAVYNFSPLLVDKLAISIKTNEIDIAISKIEEKFRIENTTAEIIREKIDYLVDCNIDRRNKYFLDIETRIRSIFLYQQEHYNWYTSDETFNNDNPWDDILVAQKDNELRIEYSIPNGVWINPEPFPWNEIERAIKLCGKWIHREMTYPEAQELYYLLEEYLDTDIPYVLYGYPHSSIRDKETYEESINGILEVGIKNPSKRIVDPQKSNESFSKIFNKFYGY